MEQILEVIPVYMESQNKNGGIASSKSVHIHLIIAFYNCLKKVSLSPFFKRGRKGSKYYQFTRGGT